MIFLKKKTVKQDKERKQRSLAFKVIIKIEGVGFRVYSLDIYFLLVCLFCNKPFLLIHRLSRKAD